MTISTTSFEFAHGCRPAGRGYWAFEFRVFGTNKWSLEFCPGDVLWSEAKRWAMKRAAELNSPEARLAS